MMPPPSPCVSICTLDDNRVCLGCRRTLEEIRGWARLPAQEQWRIVESLKRRGPGPGTQA
jgi:predicted Fe-S protein YdhL (DUF1289 family)